MNWEIEATEGVLLIRPTRKGRLLSALKRGLMMGIGVAGLASAYFLISLLGPDPISWKIQVLGGLILGALIGLLTAFARYGRVDLWVFDRSQGVLVWESRAIGSKLRNVAFSLSDLREINANGETLQITWENGTQDVLAQIGDADKASEIATQIRAYVW